MKLSDRKRLQILDAAEALFAEHGLETTSMDAISARAEVSKRTVYNHFATKDELFQAIMIRMFERQADDEVVVFNKEQSVTDQLTKIAASEVARLSSDSFIKLAKVGFIQLLTQPELAERFSQQKVGCQVYLDQFLEDACGQGVLHIDDIPFASMQFIYQLKTFVFYPSLLQSETVSEARKEQVIRETVSMFLARYGAPLR